MSHAASTCANPGCDRRLLPARRWYAIPPHERRRLRRSGVSRHAGRSLCEPCRYRASRDGTLTDFPRRTVSRAELLEEWAHLDLNRAIPRARRIEIAAPRMGMTVAALEKALERAQQETAA